MEVLVTIVVLAFGLLGVAGLQVASLKATQSSYYRSIASGLATDIIDKLRANALSQATANQATTAAYYLAPSDASTDCTTATCSASELTAYESAAWKTSLAALIPSGQGVVCLDSTPYDGTAAAKATNGCDGAAGGRWVVKIWWDDSRAKTAVGDSTAATLQRLVVIFQP